MAEEEHEEEIAQTVGNVDSLTKRKFVLLALFCALGHFCDLAGTYYRQPEQLTDEANPWFQLSVSMGHWPSWPEVIAAKLVWVVLSIWLAWLYLKHRRNWYPPAGASFREFLTRFLYGRSLTWLQTCYSIPKNWVQMLLTMGGLFAPSALHAYYLGYDNVAFARGWPTLPTSTLGSVQVDPFMGLTIIVVLIYMGVELWADYRSLKPSTSTGGTSSPSPEPS